MNRLAYEGVSKLKLNFGIDRPVRHVGLWMALAAITLAMASVAAAQPTLTTAEHDEHGTYLANSEGLAVYLSLEDEGQEGSTCYENCASTWPPLTVEGDPSAGEGVNVELLGTIQREDGSTQVTYGGWPLYTFSRDLEGFAGGQGAGGVWYLVSPEGEGIGAPTETEESVGQIDPMLVGELKSEGRELYADNCASCHGERGGGGEGIELAGYGRLANTTSVIEQILRGSRFMPSFRNDLSDRQIAAVATFIRTSWGNEFGAVTGEEVMRVR